LPTETFTDRSVDCSPLLTAPAEMVAVPVSIALSDHLNVAVLLGLIVFEAGVGPLMRWSEATPPVEVITNGSGVTTRFTESVFFTDTA
jgi:hypothetical protein